MASTTGGRSGPVADELRRRIVDGDLRPGDRVPSTRAITREWGVAMATATKVLGALREDGLVRAVPGIGTVVVERPTPQRSRPAGERSEPPVRAGPLRPPTPLSAERIVHAAVAVADAEGLAAVSMRRVGTELGVSAMSLYRHAPGKDDLVARMADLVLGEFVPPDAPPLGWRAQLELVAREQWAIFNRHPWLVHAVSLTRPNASPRALVHAEWMLAALGELGLDDHTRMQAYVSMFSFVRGTATTLDAEVTAAAESGVDPEEWMAQRADDYAALVTTAPTLARVLAGAPGFDMDLDQLFEFGLARLLDGFAVFVGGR